MGRRVGEVELKVGEVERKVGEVARKVGEVGEVGPGHTGRGGRVRLSDGLS